MVTVSRKEARPVLHPLAHFVNQVVSAFVLWWMRYGFRAFSKAFDFSAS